MSSMTLLCPSFCPIVLQEGGDLDIFTYGWFRLLYSRNQHNHCKAIIHQLNIKKKTSNIFIWQAAKLTKHFNNLNIVWSHLPGESQRPGAWWAAIYGVAQSRTQLKRLSSSSSSICVGKRYIIEYTCACWNMKLPNKAFISGCLRIRNI